MSRTHNIFYVLTHPDFEYCIHICQANLLGFFIEGWSICIEENQSNIDNLQTYQLLSK